jgi:shikimate dehydrogenase
MIDKSDSITVWSLGLIGYPLGHSFSPILHQAALEAAGLPGEYKLYPISPEANFPDQFTMLLEQLHKRQICGLNVTIPYKQIVVPYLDRLTQTAQNVQAVNTIFIDRDELVGENTDIDGFYIDLHQKLHKHKKIPNNNQETRLALVLGAGGSARSVVYGLMREGWQVMLAVRRNQQAHELLDSLKLNGERFIFHLSYEGLYDVIGEKFGKVQLVVNTTPIGMLPNTEVSPWPSYLPFPVDSFIYDLVYNPKETKLVREATASGNVAYNGLGMLIEQAALAFERWTGVIVQRQILWEAVYTRINLHGY